VLDPSGLFGYILDNAGGIVHPYQIEPVGFFVTELPVPPAIGGGVVVGQGLIVGSQ
jgi:hypothetical protein